MSKWFGGRPLVSFFLPRILGLLWLLFMYCVWTVATKFDLSNHFQPISAHSALFTDPQISLFSNFFIENESHGTIHTFKNYFTTVFFSFQFQFSVFSFQLYPNGPLIWIVLLYGCTIVLNYALPATRFTVWVFSFPNNYLDDILWHYLEYIDHACIFRFKYHIACKQCVKQFDHLYPWISM